MTIIKICGIRTPEHALAAAAAGADLIGLMFAPSKRQVSIGQATTIVATLRRYTTGRQPHVVGVFVNEAPQTVQAIATQVGLDYVQLSGDEWPDGVDQLQAPWLIAIRFDGSAREQAWCEREPQVLLLVDAHTPGSYGGSGQRADWSKAALLAAQRPLLLAGGLNPDNVAQAISEVHPWGIDVSSGVETDGVKDPEKMRAFVTAARCASDN